MCSLGTCRARYQGMPRQHCAPDTASLCKCSTPCPDSTNALYSALLLVLSHYLQVCMSDCRCEQISKGVAQRNKVSQ